MHRLLMVVLVSLVWATPAHASVFRTAKLGGALYTEERQKPLPKKVYIKEGRVNVPKGLPYKVRRILQAGNKIASTPYLWGGGHGSFSSSGYDCSGSVSYALHGAGLLDTPKDSGSLEGWGEPGKGEYVSIYANSGHVYMEVAGVRFDTSGANPSRWQTPRDDHSGYIVRHPDGL